MVESAQNCPHTYICLFIIVFGDQSVCVCVCVCVCESCADMTDEVLLNMHFELQLGYVVYYQHSKAKTIMSKSFLLQLKAIP